MKLNNEEDVIRMIEEDEWMMDILKAVKSLHLPDWWVCAGFVRSKIWDVLHGFKQRTPLPDIDVVYFDKSNINEEVEKELEEKLGNRIPHLPWSVKNEARMHLINGSVPYTSAVDAISKFPETVTALGVKLDENDKVILTAPCGIRDVIYLQVKPTPYFCENQERSKIYEERIAKKNWKDIWPQVNVISITND